MTHLSITLGRIPLRHFGGFRCWLCCHLWVRIAAQFEALSTDHDSGMILTSLRSQRPSEQGCWVGVLSPSILPYSSQSARPLDLRYLSCALKSRESMLPTKVHIVKATAFPVVMYGCERWTIKKAEHQTIEAFELWCWRRLLSVPWSERRSNQSILEEISPEYSLEGLMLKLKLPYFGHLM